MARKATIEYQVVCGGEHLLYNKTVEAEDEISVVDYGPASDLIKIDGDTKAVYIHRSHLVSVIIQTE